MFPLFQSLCILLALPYTIAATVSTPDSTPVLNLEEIAERYTRRTEGGVHLPIITRNAPTLQRRGSATASIGLGDYLDVTYSVLVTVGEITTPLILDTGSSDLWTMSDLCTQGCGGGVPVYPHESFNYSGIDVSLLYGDSKTGTFAQGEIGSDIVNLAGLKLDHQYLAAINRTNTSIAAAGSAGIFGIGFPVNSVIWNSLFRAENSVKRRDLMSREEELVKPDFKFGAPFPDLDFRISTFPTVPGLLTPSSSSGHETRQSRQTVSNGMYNVFASFSTIGPFIPRLVLGSVLARPMISVTMQRDNVDIGGNVGLLSIGELPPGIVDNSLTWVPLRMYTNDEGGFPAPPDSPNELYPLTWEVMLDGVYLDGNLLPESTISPSTVGLSALIDTGNSLIRGPEDVIADIKSQLGDDGLFPCSTSHTLAFKIGGKMFPVDPRDFASQKYEDSVRVCKSNLASTDAPSTGRGYRFGWSLGTPFLKGVLSSYYFGNITYPSQDLPKMGFLSTVPPDAGQRMRDAVVAAVRADGNFPAISESAPSGTAKFVVTNSAGIAQSTATSISRIKSNALGRVDPVGLGLSTAMGATFIATLVSTALSI